MTSKIIMAGLLVIIILAGCSVKAPEVNITGEKTALENQVIGTYREIEQDAWTLASVRSTTPGQQPTMSQEKKLVFEAVQGRKFNKDDIDEFKKAEIVGENNQGLLEIRDMKKLDADPELNTRVTTIVDNENRYRKIIMERIVLLNEQAAEAGTENVGKIFAKMNQDSSEAGVWIQSDDGTWQKKSIAK
ncbi:MAG: YdbL family protein [bacterium]|jgi:uncharacterized protein YdbL (DUF1318 family)|nr:YdbL family protein [bacterium]